MTTMTVCQLRQSNLYYVRVINCFGKIVWLKNNIKQALRKVSDTAKGEMLIIISLRLEVSEKSGKKILEYVI